ncbi:hypothetical protein GCM10027161_11120 [Microbispora hainanensis]
MLMDQTATALGPLSRPRLGPLGVVPPGSPPTRTRRGPDDDRDRLGSPAAWEGSSAGDSYTTEADVMFGVPPAQEADMPPGWRRQDGVPPGCRVAMGEGAWGAPGDAVFRVMLRCVDGEAGPGG